jgi:hypothetical protein
MNDASIRECERHNHRRDFIIIDTDINDARVR